MSDSIIYGRIAVAEAIKAGRPIEKLYVSRPPHTGSLIQIIGQAKRRRIMIQEVDKGKLDSLADIVCFCVLPAVMGCRYGLNNYFFFVIEEKVSFSRINID